MAAGTEATERCRYFLSGFCREGESCRFLHPIQYEMGNPFKPVPVCRYFLQGICAFGANCRLTGNSESQGTRVKITSSEMPQSSKSGLCLDAPEFIPRRKEMQRVSYAEALSGGLVPMVSAGVPYNIHVPNALYGDTLCPYAMMGECKFGNDCVYLHGDMCEYCGISCLHPTDVIQRKNHLKECLEQHEADMEHSFLIAQSQNKCCGICMESVLEKPVKEARFGILPNCNHVFCLQCIRQWRRSRQFENKVIRACPECRTKSDFVCPSRIWIEDPEKKKKLIDEYKNGMNQKHCKYFKQGRGDCPFGNKCFYLHQLPDGEIINNPSVGGGSRPSATQPKEECCVAHF
ncbi:unnamed protein product, partial [Darwinula stevensoni]